MPSPGGCLHVWGLREAAQPLALTSRRCAAPARPPACSHPAVLHQLRTSGERMLLLGHRSKWETVVIPDEVADVVVVLESLPYQVGFSNCFATSCA